MEDVIKERRRLILLTAGALILAVPIVSIIIWVLGPQPPKLTFELLVTLQYLSTNFNPMVASTYLWFKAQPSYDWIWGFVIAMIVAVIALAFVFYFVLPIVSAEMKERKKIKSK